MQNPVSLGLSADDLAAFDAALDTIHRVLARGVELTPPERDELPHMGVRSEVFCRQTLTLLAANPQLVPSDRELDEARAHLAALDALRPRLRQLRELVQRADDTERALGSEVIALAWEGYALLHVAGKGAALEPALHEMGTAFLRRGGEPEPALTR